MTNEAAVTQVLADYYSAFSTLDVRAILPYFHEPALLIGPPGVGAAPTSAALVSIFAPVMEDLRARGYGRSELSLQQVKRLSATAALASGVARRYKADGQELERAGVTYLLHRAEAGWKIAVVVLHHTDEVARRQ
jgi:ketosteroid isomerase-like protein